MTQSNACARASPRTGIALGTRLVLARNHLVYGWNHSESNFSYENK
jgi:hypothetical protein